jgi:hypothetical protein
MKRPPAPLDTIWFNVTSIITYTAFLFALWNPWFVLRTRGGGGIGGIIALIVTILIHGIWLGQAIQTNKNRR